VPSRPPRRENKQRDCNSPPAPVQTPGNGWPRLRWGGATPLLAFNAKTGVLDNLSAVQSSGSRSSSTRARMWAGQRLAALDDIDVNGRLVGQGPGPKSGNEDKESAEAFRTAGAPTGRAAFR
jgi:hypothetical protein